MPKREKGRDREIEQRCDKLAENREEVSNMKCKLIVRCQLLMGRPASDEDRKALDCYYETPIFDADCNCEDVEIVDEAYELFCAGKPEFRCTESVELVCVEQCMR